VKGVKNEPISPLI